MVIWGADANGQLGNRNHEEDGKYAKKEHADHRIIGPYTKESKTEKGNGAQLHRMCRRQQMIPMATWGNQELHDRTNGRSRKKAKQERTGREKINKIICQPGLARMEI